MLGIPSVEASLSSKNYIVTGAARGLGEFIARELMGAGANLLLVGSAANRLAEFCSELRAAARPGQTVHACVADLSEPDSAERVVGVARRAWARLDGLVNNAAIQGPVGVVWENGWSDWVRTLQVDLLSPVNLCRLCAPWMKAGGGGSIVNLSGGGATSPRPNFSAYATAKAALVRFSENLAREAAPLGVRVNCVAPGALNTDMLRDVLLAGRERAGPEYERALEREKKGGDPPEEAARLVAFLLSDESRAITGRLISAVWDPWRSLMEHEDELRESDLFTLRRIGLADRGKEWA